MLAESHDACPIGIMSKSSLNVRLLLVLFVCVCAEYEHKYVEKKRGCEMTNPPTLKPHFSPSRIPQGVGEILHQLWEVMAGMCWECDVVLRQVCR